MFGTARLTAKVRGMLKEAPRQHETRRGGHMTTAKFDVSVSTREGGEDHYRTEELSVLAFDPVCLALDKHAAGDELCIVGELKRNKWVKYGGEEVDQLQIVATALDGPKGEFDGAATF